MTSLLSFNEIERKQFGVELRQFISSLDITQNELAARMGVSQKTVSNYCREEYVPSNAFMVRFFKHVAVQYKPEWIIQAFSSYLTYKDVVKETPEDVLEVETDHFMSARKSLVEGIIERLECRSSELSVAALLKIVTILTDEVS